MAEIEKKVQRGTATILDAKELGDLCEIERNVRTDMENSCSGFGRVSETPVFSGNTPLGLMSAMNPPPWKRLKSLEGTKYHLHKGEDVQKTTEPVFKIITDEHGHKSCIQIGTKLIDPLPQIEANNKPLLPLERNQNFSSVLGLPIQVESNQEM